MKNIDEDKVFCYIVDIINCNEDLNLNPFWNVKIGMTGPNGKTLSKLN